MPEPIADSSNVYARSEPAIGSCMAKAVQEIMVRILLRFLRSRFQNSNQMSLHSPSLPNTSLEPLLLRFVSH